MAETLKQQTKKGLYWTFLNQFANYGLNFCIGIVMARLLSPSDYGITALPAVFTTIAWILQNGGISDALVRKTDLKEEDLSTSFYYSIIVGILIYLTLFFSAPWIAKFYETPVLVPLLRVTALSFLWGPLNSSQNVILKRRMDFKTPTKISLVTRLLSASVGIILAYMGYGLWALVISGVFSSLLTVILNWFIVRWLPHTGWSKTSFKYLWQYGNKIMLSWGLDTLYQNITPIFVAKYYSPTDLGVYNRAQGYAAMPSQQVTGVIQIVTFPALSKIQNDDKSLAHNYRKMIRVTAFIVFPLMMLLSALARPLVLTLITSKWESCIILLQIICFAMMWYPLQALNLNLLSVKGRSDLLLRVEIVKKIIGISILAITLPQGLIIFCYGSIISAIISLVINTYYTGKLIQIGFMRQMKDVFPSMMLSFLVFGIVHLINYFTANAYLQILCGGIAGVIVYIGGAILCKLPELNDVMYMFKRKE